MGAVSGGCLAPRGAKAHGDASACDELAGHAHLRASKTASPLTLQVAFRGGASGDVEAKVIKSLAELLWIDAGPSARIATASCIAVLSAGRTAEGELLQDFAVPVLNVMLHASNDIVRETLWDCFVLPSVRDDPAVAHIFYWALRCVLTAPQTAKGVRQVAEDKLQEVVRTMASQSQVATTLSRIQAANDAIKGGKELPSARLADAGGVTPLVDLLDRLHCIGEDIVKVKDRKKRQEELSNLIQDRVNEHMVDGVPVPVLMLAPQMLDPSSNLAMSKQAAAALLSLPSSEARVLSSKERAPYLIVVEVDRAPLRREAASPFGAGGARGQRGLCPCRERRPPAAAAEPEEVIPGLPPATASNPVMGSAKAPAEDAGPLPHAATMPCVSEASEHEEHEEVVARYLRDQDIRPKGAFNKESWEEVVQRVRGSSKQGARRGWAMLSLIVKSNADDVRQEELAYRLLKWFQRVFRRHRLKLWLHPFLIVATRHDGGVLETVTNAISLSDLKKSYGDRWHSLRAYFEQTFRRGGEMTPSPTGVGKVVPLEKAVMNFIWSMASYSVVCYVLAIRDRHNGNILIDDEGHILHVDFGFMLCGAPGGKTMQKMGGFELSDGFKLTKEFVEVLGPELDQPFQVFRQAVLDGLVAVRKHADELLALLQLSMLGAENFQMNCFHHPKGRPEHVLEDICDRLGLQGVDVNGAIPAMTEEEFRASMDKKVVGSIDHWRSRLYDKYQYHFTGVH